ncbi:MAG: extracellular solute-binding protein [Candidatus Acidiferrales bacterium]
MSVDRVVRLRGTAWCHTRGFLPMVATAQRFAEAHPGFEIEWDARSLQEFADSSIAELARQYDLMVIDHPSIGQAAEENVLLPLNEWIPEEFLGMQAAASVGASHASYAYAGRQWALAIDAAAPIAGWRPDLLRRAEAAIPRTWSELLELAGRGLVTFPAKAIDSLMHFYMFCDALGAGPFREDNAVVSEEIGIRALKMLGQLFSLCDAQCLKRNPIATWELLSTSDTVAYCPFAYGYSNYSRAGYSTHALETGNLIATDDGLLFHSTLGGAGLAISARCAHKAIAAEYAQFVASPHCQSTLYFDSGGQPGNRTAWMDDEVNRRCINFFRNTLHTLERAYVRPRFAGYLEFQEHAAVAVHRYLAAGRPEEDVIAEMNDRLREARSEKWRGVA